MTYLNRVYSFWEAEEEQGKLFYLVLFYFSIIFIILYINDTYNQQHKSVFLRT